MELNIPKAEDVDRAAFDGRSYTIDRGVLDQLCYLGNYVRDLPVSLARMMENAHDWEHLPFVHPSSFAAIAPVETGSWGWRCKTVLPDGGAEQLIELLVDPREHYWATTVVDGPGKGTQIHTRASDHAAGGITVDVRFFLPQAPESPEQAAMVLAFLQTQYARLYDEDLMLMNGRQQALDDRRALRGEHSGANGDLGEEASLDRHAVHHTIVDGVRVLVRFHAGQWMAHAARCPHALGPLDGAEIDERGHIACPWHGYRFDLADGKEERARCGALQIFHVAVENARLVVRSAVTRA